MMSALNSMFGLQIFLWGCFGGILVDIVEFCVAARKRHYLVRFKDWQSYVAVLLLAVAGGLMAVALDAETGRYAVMIGMGLPVLVRLGARGTGIERFFR